MTSVTTRKKPTKTGTRRPGRRRRWSLILGIGLGIPAVCVFAVLGYYYVVIARLVDERLQGQRERVVPRVFARPLELRAGELLSERQLIDRLNDLGYAERQEATGAGEFALIPTGVTLVPRSGPAAGKVVRVVFRKPAPLRPGPTTPAPALDDRLQRIEMAVGGIMPSVQLESPMLTALAGDSRQKRRQVPLAQIPRHVVNAVLAIEDRRFYEHPGFDPIGLVGAVISNLRGERRYLAGGSTITQQLVKNVFLAALMQNPTERTMKRKLLELFMALVLERRASKDEILGLYLNEVYLGQRGSFAIHGIPEAARLFFGKDVSNLSVAEAATTAGVIHSPYNLSPFTAPERAKTRRNVVIRAMVDSGFLAEEAAKSAEAEPLTTVARALDAEAPYFVDLVSQTLNDAYAKQAAKTPQAYEVYTTLDLNLQRLAQDAVREGLQKVDDLLKRRRVSARAQAALIAVDPRTGEVLALVGGRSYNQSQYNRATTARRQPGSVFKPFVYLSAFEWAASEQRTDVTPAMVVNDEPTTFLFEKQEWTPSNYENDYGGMITLREALAHSRNIATIKVAEMAGYDKISDLWRRIGAGTPPRPYPSIALGVFEATPLEIATAFTIFPNLGELRPLQTIMHVTSGGKALPKPPVAAPKRIARPDTTFLVTNMMRSVLNEGTAASARALGFTLDAAGKTGTTNDLRDAWFAGFTPELLTVVWVGYDDNQALGLSGAQAALPIWTSFMIKALAGRPNLPFDVPEGIVFATIDRDTGKLSVPGCPRVISEAFLAGTEPTERCTLHKY
jgi:penicillin-binding protein 1B